MGNGRRRYSAPAKRIENNDAILVHILVCRVGKILVPAGGCRRGCGIIHIGSGLQS